MIRNLKALGLAFLAVFAIGAVAAGSAQAEPGAGPSAFTFEEYPATGTGEQPEGEPTVFARGGRTVKCATANYTSAEVTEASTTITVVPKYSGCSSTVLGTEFPATVTFPEGCHYIFHATADVITHEDETKTDTFTATSQLTCPEGKDVSIHVYKSGTTPEEHENTEKFLCSYTFTNQENLKTIDLTNEAANPTKGTPKNWILAHLNIGGITSLRTHGSGLTCGVEHHTEGTLTGTVKLKGKNGANETIGLTVSTEPKP